MSSPPEPGWYKDPEGVHQHQAWWDGEKWTGATRRARLDAPKVRLGFCAALAVALLLLLAWGVWSLLSMGEFGFYMIVLIGLAIPVVGAILLFGWWATGSSRSKAKGR